jgi:hypothetical protein
MVRKNPVSLETVCYIAPELQCMFGRGPKFFCYNDSKNKQISPAANGQIEIIFSLYRGAGWKDFQLPIFCSHVRKKKEKQKKNQFVFEGQNGGFKLTTYNLQQPCTTNGDKCKREKNHFTGTHNLQLQTKLHVFLPHSPP